MTTTPTIARPATSLHVVTACAHCATDHVADSPTFEEAAVEARADGWWSKVGVEWWCVGCQADFWRSGCGLSG